MRTRTRKKKKEQNTVSQRLGYSATDFKRVITELFHYRRDEFELSGRKPFKFDRLSNKGVFCSAAEKHRQAQRESQKTDSYREQKKKDKIFPSVS